MNPNTTLTELTSYGQIDIYDKYFENVAVPSTTSSPTKCLTNRETYCTIHNTRELPIMIGSGLWKKYHADDNPLGIYGYFIIDGVIKFVNNIKMDTKNPVAESRMFKVDKTRLEIKSFLRITQKIEGKETPIGLPANYILCARHSANQKQLMKYLDIMAMFMKKERPIQHPCDQIAFCYMLDVYFGFRAAPDKTYRLITPGELIHDMITRQENVVECFRTHTWKVKYLQNVYSVSEDLQPTNIIGAVESVRRITLPKNRETTRMVDREVKLYNKRKICPVQTPDGVLCGTVLYLARGAKLVHKDSTDFKSMWTEVHEKDGVHLYIDENYTGVYKKEDVEPYAVIYGSLAWIHTKQGRIIEGDHLLSYAGSLLPGVTHNPPIRAMFSTGMVKQAISSSFLIIHNTKILHNGEQPVYGPALPVEIGRNCLVAIMPWHGYNVEDALVVSTKCAEEYTTTKYSVYRTPIQSKTVKVYVEEDQKVDEHEALFMSYDDTKIQTIETTYTANEGVVHKIEWINEESVCVTIKKTRHLKVGDKMTSRHGQKGVISKIVPLENMPYISHTGKHVDLIMNPHAFPSRMTMGQLHEINANGDLENVSFKNEHGTIVNIENKILVGKCYYMPLRHQSSEKFQVRYTEGRRDLITRQPVAGKRNKGGLRFGQMERDILFAVEAWKIIKEIWSVDMVKIYVDNKGKIYSEPGDAAADLQELSVKYVHQYMLICIGYLRGMWIDIRWFPQDNKYQIVENFDYPETDTLSFGDLNPLDVRKYKDELVLPICLRSPLLNKLYRRPGSNMAKIGTEIRSLLKSKQGAYHELVEGHRVNNCLRGVIVPDPLLPFHTVGVPKSVVLPSSYGLLNRQPSLDLTSLSYVKIQHSNDCNGDVIHMHPSMCKLFNADFDGDEMNIFFLINEASIKEARDKLVFTPQPTQDYIYIQSANIHNVDKLTEHGLTATYNDFKNIVNAGSKGKEFNLQQMYTEIKEKPYNYNDGVPIDFWYELAQDARYSAASISLNTPITGHLTSVCNNMYN